MSSNSSNQKTPTKYNLQCEKQNFKITCRICRKHFESLADREEHRLTHIKVFRCFICNIRFHEEADFLIHTEKLHNGRNRELEICNKCGRQFSAKPQLRVHLSSKCGTEKKFACKECGVKLMTVSALNSHKRRHAGTRPYLCRFCAKTFSSAGELTVHERAHTKEKIFVCNVCNKGFCHRQSLITHASIHTGIKPYQCEGCGSSFSCVGNLLKHRKSHANTCGLAPLTAHSVRNPDTRAKVRANMPDGTRLRLHKRKINLIAALEKHSANESTSDPNPVPVEEIEVITLDANAEENSKESNDDSQTKKTNDLQQQDLISNDVEEDDDDDIPIEILDSDLNSENSNDVHDENNETKTNEITESDKTNSCDKSIEDKQGCRYCNMAYGKAGWLERHEKWHEEGGDKEKAKRTSGYERNKCSICKTVFDSLDEKRKHQSEKHKDKLGCHLCKQVLGTPFSKRIHILHAHMGVPRKVYRFVCDKCGKTVASKALIEFHKKNNCGEDKPYKCDKCEKKFSTSNTLRTHSKLHENIKSQLCKFCGKSFMRKLQLTIHERKHTGEKPYQCQLCPKSFAYRESLITHNSIHTGVRPYLCQGCGFRFSCISNLIKHRRTHAATCGEIPPDSNPVPRFKGLKGLNMLGVRLKRKTVKT